MTQHVMWPQNMFFPTSFGAHPFAKKIEKKKYISCIQKFYFMHKIYFRHALFIFLEPISFKKKNI